MNIPTDHLQWPARRTDVRLRHQDDGHALYDPRRGAVHLLNDTALAVWELCDGRTSPEEMAGGICEVFRATPDRVLGDVERALAELAAAGLIAWEDPKDAL